VKATERAPRPKNAAKGRIVKHFIGASVAPILLSAAPAAAESTVILPNGSRASSRGAAANLTGSVIVEPLYAANDHRSSTGGACVLRPGARYAGHPHPGGQILIVTAVIGWIQEQGGEKREIKAGDVIWTPPGTGTAPPLQFDEPYRHQQYGRRQERKVGGAGR
jgi:quercetin dioxygenase-like cupin family protein